ncbi:MAG: hypothetical protein GY707_09240 [Desulfobacteraceae bacterium]|nr:hypothetical protein [Desulfobacteraceae bacterium]
MKKKIYGMILVLSIFFIQPIAIKADSTGVGGTNNNKYEKTAKAIIEYLLEDDTNIGNDHVAQDKWLSRKLKSELANNQEACKQAQKLRPTDKILLPNNNNFVHSWEKPSFFKILGYRKYEKIVFVDVQFKWSTDQNYAGEQRIEFFIFIMENNTWKLDDVYNVRSNFSEPESLSSYLQSYPK